MTKGKLYGVGVGPGAPDLLTLRALRTLESVDVLAIPRPNKWSKSLAWRIAEPNLEDKPEQEKLFLTFPMTKDPDILIPAWTYAFDEIGNAHGRRAVAVIGGGKGTRFKLTLEGKANQRCIRVSTFDEIFGANLNDHARVGVRRGAIGVTHAIDGHVVFLGGAGHDETARTHAEGIDTTLT